jgi:hypothetical protein
MASAGTIAQLRSYLDKAASFAAELKSHQIAKCKMQSKDRVSDGYVYRF